MRRELSVSQARRIALAVQGLAGPRPTAVPTRAHLRRVLGHTKLLQMDSVNILARAHYLPMFSRVGPYDERILNTAAWSPTSRSPRLLAEYWAHEAALIPVIDWPLMRWRMEDFADGRYRFTREMLRRNRSAADDVVDVVAERGASTPREIEDALGLARGPRRSGGWWDLGEVKHLCEAMFAGGVFSATRDANFTRHYDLAQRIVGTAVVEESVPRADAIVRLVARAGAAHGVATVADLADYYRLKASQVRQALPQLLADGELTEVGVEGWPEPAYLHRDAVLPRSASRTALLSPFDPLVFFRPRTERLFGFHYRIEIYVPAHKRVHGYYVLPYLRGENLAARVDLKADRRAGVLEVLAAHAESSADRGETAMALAVDLEAMAAWRGLDAVRVHPRGDLGGPLAHACRHLM